MSKLSPPKTFGLQASVKGLFFDRALVKSMADDVVRKGLNKAGAQIRLTMIRSMRKVGKKGTPSVPGEPPKFRATHNEAASLRHVLYHYDPQSKSVVVGPIMLNQLQYAGGSKGRISRGTVPAVHEFGGTIGVREKFIPFTLAAAYRRFGKSIADEFKRSGTWMARADAERIYGKDAKHMIDENLMGIWVPVGRTKRNRIVMRARNARYPKRPFAQPALFKMLPRIPEQFRGTVGTT